MQDFSEHTAAAITKIAQASVPEGTDGTEIAARALAVAFDVDVPGLDQPVCPVPHNEVWVEITGTRDEDGRVSFRSYWPDGSHDDWHCRLAYWHRKVVADWLDMRVLTAQEAQAFHARSAS